MNRPLFLLLFVLGGGLVGAETRVTLLGPDYPPFSGSQKDQRLWCDLVDAALARQGISVDWSFLPLARMKAEVGQGANLGFLNSTLVLDPEERRLFLTNTPPLLVAEVVAFYHRSRFPEGLGLKKPHDLKGRAVGVLLGTGSVEVLAEAGVPLNIGVSVESLVKMFRAHRFDVLILSDLTGFAGLEKYYPEGRAEVGYEPVYRSPIDLVFSAKAPGAADLRAHYLEGLTALRADGTFAQLVARYQRPPR